MIAASLSIFDQTLDVLVLSIGPTVLNHEALDQVVSPKSRNLSSSSPSSAILLQVSGLLSERKIFDSVTATRSSITLGACISFNESRLFPSRAWVLIADLFEQERQ